MKYVKCSSCGEKIYILDECYAHIDSFEKFCSKECFVKSNSKDLITNINESILTKRLSEYYRRNMSWNSKYITNEMIAQAIKNKTKEETSVFGNNNTSNPEYIIKKSDDWHIARIIYFINHPDEIKGLVVKNRCCYYDGMLEQSKTGELVVELGYSDSEYNVIYPYVAITDGHHRFRAAEYIGLEKMNCVYSGRKDVLDYLTGKTDDKLIVGRIG